MKIINMVILIGVVILAVGVFGCAAGGSNFGQPITETTTTPIGNILAQPAQFVGKMVRIEGKITDECPSGGWFFLEDATGLIYVNLHPSNFAISQARGRQVIAQGVVRKEGIQVEIIGEGVQIK